MVYMFLLSVEIFLLFFLSGIISKKLSEFLSINLISAIFLPGIILHELAHLFMATILFVPVGEIEFIPKKEGSKLKLGSVKIAKTDPFRCLLVGLAPVIFGVTVIVGLTYFFVSNYLFILQLKFYFFIILVLIYIYILFAISNTMFSSREDMRGALELLIIAFLVSTAIYLLGIRVSLVYLSFVFNEKFIELIRLSVIFLLIPIGIDSFLLWLIKVFN